MSFEIDEVFSDSLAVAHLEVSKFDLSFSFGVVRSKVDSEFGLKFCPVAKPGWLFQ